MRLSEAKKKFKNQYILFKYIDKTCEVKKIFCHSKRQSSVLMALARLPKPYSNIALIFNGEFPQREPALILEYPIPGRLTPLLIEMPANQLMHLPANL